MKVQTQRLLHDSLLFSAEKIPDKIAIIVDGNEFTYRQLLNHSLRFAKVLIDRNLQRGDRVAIYMDNTWSCIVSIFGVLIAGGVFLIINPQTKNDKLAYVINDSEAKFLITDGHLANIFITIISKLVTCTHIICSGKIPEIETRNGTNIEMFDEVIKKTDALSEKSNVIPIDIAALIYTSGSTGNPKGVTMTHQSMLFAARSIIEYLRLTSEDKILCVLPLAFDYGLYQLLMTVTLGATIILERSFTYATSALNILQKYKASVFPGVPTIFATIISMHKRNSLCFPTVTCITNTAAALSPDFIPYLKEIFPNALIFKMYGLTECKRVSYLDPAQLNEKIASVGKAIPGTEIFLLSKDGKSTPVGKPGILHVRGPHVMLGYWKQPELSDKMLKDGLYPGEKILCTHDWFKQDEDGFFYFLGRNDDIIKTRGEKVSPVEVENTLYSINGIKDAAVIGVPDDLLGEKIEAYVVIEKGSDLNEKLIKKICMSKLENFMVPSAIIIVKELPKTNTGKIYKKGLTKIIEVPYA